VLDQGSGADGWLTSDGMLPSWRQAVNAIMRWRWALRWLMHS